MQDNPAEMCTIHELNVNMREIHLVGVKYFEDTWPGHQLEACRKQHKVLCKRLKANKVILHTILLGVGDFKLSRQITVIGELPSQIHKPHYLFLTPFGKSF